MASTGLPIGLLPAAATPSSACSSRPATCCSSTRMAASRPRTTPATCSGRSGSKQALDRRRDRQRRQRPRAGRGRDQHVPRGRDLSRRRDDDGGQGRLRDGPRLRATRAGRRPPARRGMRLTLSGAGRVSAGVALEIALPCAPVFDGRPSRDSYPASPAMPVTSLRSSRSKPAAPYSAISSFAYRATPEVDPPAAGQRQPREHVRTRSHPVATTTRNEKRARVASQFD